MPNVTDEELKEKVQDGYLVESVEEMTDGYRKSLIVQLTVQADTELMSAPAYWRAARHAPSTTTPVSAVRKGDWKLLEYFEDGRIELFNLKKDLGETTDLSSTQLEIAKRLATELRTWRQEVGALLPEPNPARK